MSQGMKDMFFVLGLIGFLGYLFWLYFEGLQYAKDQPWLIIALVPLGIGLALLSDVTKER